MQDKNRSAAYWSLRVALGVVPILAGLDKFTNLLTQWEGYLGPLARGLIPVSPALFMRAVGIVEVGVGAAILLGQARWAGWVAMGWLAAIALQLVTTGQHLDVAARDLVMATAAFALARLAPAEEAAHATHARPAATGAAHA